MIKILLWALGLWLWSAPAMAHEFRAAVLSIDARADGVYEVAWTVRRGSSAEARLRPHLPGHCQSGPKHAERHGATTRSSWTVNCGAVGLAGQNIRVEGLADPDSVFLRVNAERETTVTLHAGAPAHTLSATGAEGGNGWMAYARLGVEHIVTGIDHVAFLLVLVLWVGGGLRLVSAVTGFTIGHSITLALAVTGQVAVPAEPVETLIALSVVYVALALALGKRATETSTPWLAPAGFGLLHGLGFAGALTELGIPTAEIPKALFAFNVGVELAQLGLVGVALGALWLVRKHRQPWARTAVAYGVGSVAAFWTLDRAAWLWGAS